jgi:hypothetical protein
MNKLMDGEERLPIVEAEEGQLYTQLYTVGFCLIEIVMNFSENKFLKKDI